MASDDDVIQDFMGELGRDPYKKRRLADAIRSQSFENIARVISSILVSIGRAVDDIFGFVGDVMSWFNSLF